MFIFQGLLESVSYQADQSNKLQQGGGQANYLEGKEK
jgi:hypothetical protein